MSSDVRAASVGLPHRSDATTVAIVGGSGFVGRAVAHRMSTANCDVRIFSAPRLRWTDIRPRQVQRVPGNMHCDVVERLAEALAGASVVIDAAGIANGSAQAGPVLWGANALMPVLVARASRLVGVKRFIHLSSAAAQGRLVLDET